MLNYSTNTDFLHRPGEPIVADGISSSAQQAVFLSLRMVKTVPPPSAATSPPRALCVGWVAWWLVAYSAPPRQAALPLHRRPSSRSNQGIKKILFREVPRELES